MAALTWPPPDPATARRASARMCRAVRAVTAGEGRGGPSHDSTGGCGRPLGSPSGAGGTTTPSTTPSLPDPRFTTLPHGLTVRYWVWGGGGHNTTAAAAPTLLLLHDAGETGAAWGAVAARLARGGAAATVIAPDLRGHGGTTGNCSFASPEHATSTLAADVARFIVEADLSGRPLAVAGSGLGAAAAAALAAASPRLVGALAVLAYDGPRSAPQAFTPWQAGVWDGPAEAAACLASPAWGLGTGLSATAAASAHPAALTRPIPRPDGRGVAYRSACDPAWFCAGGSLSWLEGRREGEGGEEDGREEGLSSPPPPHPTGHTHTLVLRGGCDGSTTPAAASSLARRYGTRLTTLPGVRRAVALEAPASVAACLGAWLATAAAAGAFTVPDPAARTPEALGLCTLPTYPTLEAAIKALVRRPPPTEAAVRDAWLAAGGTADEWEAEAAAVTTSGVTGLARDPPGYFGFCG